MEKFDNFIMAKGENENSLLIIPQLFVNDVYDIIQEFNKVNNEVKQGFIHMDLQTIVGNREKKYVSYEIFNYKIIRNSKVLINDVILQNELQNLKSMYHKQLNSKTLNDLIVSEQSLLD